MLWPIVLPLKITLCILAGFFVATFIVSTLLKWRPGKAMLVSTIVSLLAFLPICAGVGSFVDSQRFGIFYHDTYAGVQDVRVERYLPPTARAITLEKFGMGHRAKYTITLPELTEYLDASWDKSNGRSAVSREELGDGESISGEHFDHLFDKLDWILPESALHFCSPVQSDGGGADYYFDDKTNTVFQIAGYF